MDTNIVVLAGGYSVRDYDLWKIPRSRACIIGVNDGAYQFPVNHAVTMDRLWFEHRYPAVVHRPLLRKFWIRKGINKIYPELAEKVVEFDCDPEAPCVLSPKGTIFNGSNSGTVALNLAFQLSLARIFLLGYDMQKGPEPECEPYWYPRYSWNASGGTKPGKYGTWAREFEGIAQQMKAAGLKVYNVNHRSKIEAFPVISYEVFLRMLHEATPTHYPAR